MLYDFAQFDFASTISELKWLGGREDEDKVSGNEDFYDCFTHLTE